MDGSAGVFAEALAPLREPGLEVAPIVVAREIASEAQGRLHGVIRRKDSDRLLHQLRSFGHRRPGLRGERQRRRFRREIAPARTFVLESEIDGIRKRGSASAARRKMSSYR